MKIFPRQIDFFEIFDRAIANVANAAELIEDLFTNFEDVPRKVQEIHDLEQEGDILTHDIMRRLNQTFLTPIDREDIHALASTIDDVLDLLWGTADRLIIYDIKEPTRAAIHLAGELRTTTIAIQKAVRELRNKDYAHVQEHCIEINRLENSIDRIFRDAIGSLFKDYDDPKMIIKWKDLYEHLEDAADRCEDVANILESIVLKHA